MNPIPLKSEAETLALGAHLATILQPGDVIALSGDLGAGKTTLARGLIQSKLGPIEVPSPTYTLVQTYEWGQTELWHCDLYRLEHPDDVYELGLMDAIDDAILLVEWADKMGALWPNTAMSIDLAFDGAHRVATLSGWEGRHV